MLELIMNAIVDLINLPWMLKMQYGMHFTLWHHKIHRLHKIDAKHRRIIVLAQALSFWRVASNITVFFDNFIVWDQYFYFAKAIIHDIGFFNLSGPKVHICVNKLHYHWFR